MREKEKTHGSIDLVGPLFSVDSSSFRLVIDDLTAEKSTWFEIVY